MTRSLPILPVIIGVFLLGLTTHRITASENPALITTLCERKNGDIYAINDGYSLRTSCLGRDRLVVIDGGSSGIPGPTGPQGTTGATGPKYALPEQGSVGFIGYVAGDAIFVLKKDKKIYYRDNDTDWVPVQSFNNWSEPWDVPIPIEQIVDFKHTYLIDTNGDIWQFFADGPEDREWINIGQP